MRQFQFSSNIIYIGYLQMRIDFSQLEQEEAQPTSANSSFSNGFPQMWKHVFNKEKSIPIAVAEQEQQSLSFSVNYPYEVTRSVSPSAINKELAYLQAKKILPTSTLRFIHNTLQAQLEKQSQKQQIKQKSKQASPQKQKSSEKTIERQSEGLGLTIKLKSICRDENLDNNKKNRRKKHDHVKPKVYDIKKQIKQQRYSKQQDLNGVTLKPILNYTMNSKTAKKVQKKRNHHFKTYQTNVFQSLYYDAAVYSTKKQMQKMTIEQQESRIISQNRSRVKVYSTFEERLQTSIEKDAQRKKKAQNKLEYDLSTGQKFFVPNTSKSKITYFTLFKSLSPRYPNQSQSFMARPSHYSRQSTKFNNSLEKATTLNNSFEHTINTSLDSKYKIARKALPKQNKLAQLYADLLWSEQQLKTDVLSKQQKHILHLFLEEIKNHYNHYSRSISKQVFIAFFKEVYANMNLFDRSILENRLKQKKKNLKQQIYLDNEYETDRKHQKTLLSTRNFTDRQKITTQSRLNHTHKHFFI